MQHQRSKHAQKWHVHIWKATSTNDMHHELRLAHIPYVVCTQARLFVPWFQCIDQATSPLACAHRQSEIGQRQVTATNVYTLNGGVCAQIHRHQNCPTQSGHATSSNGGKNQHRPSRIIRGMRVRLGDAGHCMQLLLDDMGHWQDVSTKVFKHLTWFVHIWKPTSNYDKQLHSRHVHITYVVCASLEGH